MQGTVIQPTPIGSKGEKFKSALKSSALSLISERDRRSVQTHFSTYKEAPNSNQSTQFIVIVTKVLIRCAFKHESL